MSGANVVKSLVLGVIVGLALQILGDADTPAGDRALTVLVSAGAGLVVGIVSEWLTSLLPIRLARTGTYFVVNSVIAVVVAVAVTVTLIVFTGAGPRDAADAWPVVVIVVAIVGVAYIVDHFFHQRTQRRLRLLQESLTDAAGESE